MTATKNPRGMDRTRYPVAPEVVRASLIENGAGYLIEGQGRSGHRPLRFKDLMTFCCVAKADRSGFSQQLQDMMRNRFKEFGVHYAYYPTGWQVRVGSSPIDPEAGK